MKALGKIHVTVWLLGLAGAALFTILLIHQGLPQVGAAFAAAGWAIAAVVVFHFAVPVFLDALAWWILFPKSERPALIQLLWMRWIGESVSTLVPSAAVGGDIVRARLAAINGTPLPLAAGSVLVDITLGIFVQIAFTLFGLGLIVSSLPLPVSILSSGEECFVLLASLSQSWPIRRSGIRSCKAATRSIKQFENCTRGEAVWWGAACGRLFRWSLARAKSGSLFTRSVRKRPGLMRSFSKALF